jgi:hypothetical protein
VLTVCSTWIFTTPPYIKATKVNIAMTVMIMASALANVAWLSFRNKQKATQEEEYVPQGKKHLLDDSAPDFKYTL